MPRIRTIKPDYFRHELLQDLEASYPDLHPMLVFAGLWGHCDKNGVFEYRPRQLKLDILPFLDFDMAVTLDLLAKNNLIILMSHGEATGKQQGSIEERIYGFVPTFKDHQRINGKEAQEESKFPQASEMTEWKQRGSVGEATGKQSRRQEGKGREQEGNRNRKSQTKSLAVVLPDWLPLEAWGEFIEMRKGIRKPLTPGGVKLAIGALEKLRASGNDPEAVLNQSILNSWQGLFEIKKSPLSKREEMERLSASVIANNAQACREFCGEEE